MHRSRRRIALTPPMTPTPHSAVPHFMSIATALAIAALVALPAQAALYKWIDASGRVVYSDQPPPGDVKVETIAGPAPPANPNAVKDLANKEMDTKKQAQEAAANAKKAMAQRADAEKRGDACREARAELSRLAADQVLLYSVNEKGEPVMMNDAERRRRRENTELFLKSNCPPV